MSEEQRPYNANPAQAIIDVLRAEMNNTHTAMPGVVTAYNALASTANIQPAFLTDLGNPLPLVPDVPVMFPGAGDWSITWNLKVGSKGMLFFCERDITNYLATAGNLLPPATDRTFSLSDSFFYPGGRPAAEVEAVVAGGLPDALVIRNISTGDEHVIAMNIAGDTVIHVGAGKLVNLGGSPGAEFVALANLVLAELTAIRAAFDIHTHGGGPPPVPLFGGPGGAVAATRVKAL